MEEKLSKTEEKSEKLDFTNLRNRWGWMNFLHNFVGKVSPELSFKFDKIQESLNDIYERAETRALEELEGTLSPAEIEEWTRYIRIYEAADGLCHRQYTNQSTVYIAQLDENTWKCLVNPSELEEVKKHCQAGLVDISFDGYHVYLKAFDKNRT